MNTSTLRRTAAATVAAGSLLALAACGPLGSSASGDKSGEGGTAASPSATASNAGGSPLNGVAHATAALDLVRKAATGAHSAKVETLISLGGTMSMKADGAMDWAHGLTGDMTMTYTRGAAAQGLKDAGAPTSMEARYLPDAYYVDMGPAMAAHLGGKRWVKYGFDDLAKLTGGSGSYLKDTMQNYNPVKSVNAALASPNIVSLGTATVRGVPTTHYRGTVSLSEVTGNGRAALSTAEQQALREAFTKSGIASETVDLWVSKDNLPVEALVSANTRSGVMKSQTFYSDFGADVKVTAPPAAQTADLSTLMDQQGNG